MSLSDHIHNTQLRRVLDDDASPIEAGDTVERAVGKLQAQIDAGSGGTGDVVGPASATDGNIASFDGATGKLLQDSGYAVTDFAPAAAAVPVGGAEGQVLSKASDTDRDTEWTSPLAALFSPGLSVTPTGAILLTLPNGDTYRLAAELIPPVPTGNLVRHWKLNTGLTQSGGTASAWADQIGGASLAQADSSRQPAVQTSGTLLFDGSNDGLQWVGTLNMPCAILLRCRFITWSSAAGGDFLLNGSTLFTPRVYQDGVTPDIYLTAGGANLGPLSPTLGTWVTMLVNLNHSGANSYLHVEGVGTTSTGATGINNPGGITLGANGSFSGNYGNVEVAEVLVYDTQFATVAAAADAIAYLETINP